MKKAKRSTKKGFTLIELIVVIAILGILAAVLLPKFSGFTDDARKKTAMSEAKSCYSALAAYYAANGAYPTAVVETDGSVKAGINLSAEMAKKVGTVTSTSTGTGVLFTYHSKGGSDGIAVQVSEEGKILSVS